MPNVTTEEQVDHSDQPILFNLEMDPQERYPIPPANPEYKFKMAELMSIYNEHLKTMVKGKPQLNWCDISVMNWAPLGCEKFKSCYKIPKSNPQKCYWDH